jgi:hypothetical protein
VYQGKEVAKFTKDFYVNELISLAEFQQGNYADALTESFHRIDTMLEDLVKLYFNLIPPNICI